MAFYNDEINETTRNLLGQRVTDSIAEVPPLTRAAFYLLDQYGQPQLSGEQLRTGEQRILPPGGVDGDVLIMGAFGPQWVSGMGIAGGGTIVSVTDGMASFMIYTDKFSWPVEGPPWDVPPTAGVTVEVTEGLATLVATLSGGGLNHSFPVNGDPSAVAVGFFIPSVIEGVCYFTLGPITYDYVVIQS